MGAVQPCYQQRQTPGDSVYFSINLHYQSRSSGEPVNGLKDKRVTPCVMAEHIGLLVSVKACVYYYEIKRMHQELKFSNSNESRHFICLNSCPLIVCVFFIISYDRILMFIDMFLSVHRCRIQSQTFCFHNAKIVKCIVLSGYKSIRVVTSNLIVFTKN